MTIAACYVSSEGVVFGADSTTTMYVQDPGQQDCWSEHHFNFAQKIFQIGEENSLAITMWGLGELNGLSYRTLIAQFADDLLKGPAKTMQEVADRWAQHFWAAYAREFAQVLARTKVLRANTQRTPQEEDELESLMQSCSGGFCLGGCCLPDRTPQAFETSYSPDMAAAGPPVALPMGSANFWGCPNLIHRLIIGADLGLLKSLLRSGKWSGTAQELIDLVRPYSLEQPTQLPIREAMDWVHASIYATIKTMKFSHMAPVCGGPIEVAVITTDRPFRWVRHKYLDAAVTHDGFTHV